MLIFIRNARDLSISSLRNLELYRASKKLSYRIAFRNGRSSFFVTVTIVEISRYPSGKFEDCLCSMVDFHADDKKKPEVQTSGRFAMSASKLAICNP